MMKASYNESYPLKDTIAVACAVFREQGFVKSNEGYYDPDREVRIDDNRSACLATLRKANGIDIPNNVRTVEPTEEDRNHSEVVFKFFDQRLMMGKIGDTLSPYESDLITPFEDKECDARRDLGRIASLPNSFVIAKKREKMQSIFDANRRVGSFVGSVKDRLKIEAEVMDVKFLPKQDSYIITAMTDAQQIVKFFIGKDPSDTASAIANRRITFVGTVRSHEVSTYSNCHETVFNRVKIFE